MKDMALLKSRWFSSTWNDHNLANWTILNGNTYTKYTKYESKSFTSCEEKCELLKEQWCHLVDDWEHDISCGGTVGQQLFFLLNAVKNKNRKINKQ